MQLRYFVVIAFLVLATAVYVFMYLPNAAQPAARAIPINASDLYFMPNPRFNVTSSTITSTSPVLKNEGFLSVSDKVFTNYNITLANSTVITFTLIVGSNSNVTNSLIQGELNSTNMSPYRFGSYLSTLKETTLYVNNIPVQMYTFLDVGVFNVSQFVLTQNKGLPIMPIYQFQTLLTYKKYYESVVIDAFTNSSIYANDSIRLAALLANRTIA